MKNKKYLKLLLFLLLGRLEYDFSLKRFKATRYKKLYPLDWCVQQIELLAQLKYKNQPIFCVSSF